MHRHTANSFNAALILAVVCAIQSSTSGTTFNWNLDRDGDWEQRSNWSPIGIPGRPIDEAVFGRIISRPRTVTATSSSGVEVAGIRFDSLHTYTIDGTARAGFVNLTSADGPASIAVLRGTHEFGTAVNFQDRVELNVAAGSRLDFNGLVSFRGNIASTIGDGEYRFNVGLSHTDVSGLLVGEAGTISGVGAVGADFENIAATVAPGTEVTGVLTVVGDYAQEDGGRLRIRVGGTGLGMSDRLNVTGAAGLNGHLELVFADGFVPHLNQTIPFITAARGVGGTFDLVSFANAPGQFAANLVTSGGAAQLNFVPPVVTNQFSSTNLVATWHSPTIWSGGVIPSTTNVIALRNTLPIDQRVLIGGSSVAQVHDLSIQGNGTNTMSLDIQNGGNLSVAHRLTVGPLGVLQISGGSLFSSEVHVIDGGALYGSGRVTGDVVVGGDVGGEAIISPGAGAEAVGNLVVDGDYRQASGGNLVIDIHGVGEGQYDTIEVLGHAELTGRITFNVTNPDAIPAGEKLVILKADSLDGLILEPAFSAGPDINIHTMFDPENHQVLSGTSHDGDMDCVDGINSEDLRLFAMALIDQDAYNATHFFPAHVTGDMDDNGRLDFDDIELFAQALPNMSEADVVAAIESYANAAAQVPEPTTAAIGTLCVLLAPLLRRARIANGRRRP